MDPTKSGATDYLAHSFAVWSSNDRFGILSTVKVASFRYLLEAIDYCQAVAARGAATVLRMTATTVPSVSHYGPADAARGGN